MSIHYSCKYCSKNIGQVTDEYVRYGELKLSLTHTNDYQDMVTVLSNGDLSVKTVCEDCEEYVLQFNQDFSKEHFIQ